MATITKTTAIPAGNWVRVDGDYPGLQMKRRLSYPMLYFVGAAAPGSDSADGVQDWNTGSVTIRDLAGSKAYVKALGDANVIELFLFDAATKVGLQVGGVDLSGTNPAPIVTPGAAVVVANFSRPADTIAYAIGDLIANSTASGSVAPLTLPVARANDKTGMVRRLRAKTTNAAWANKTVRFHLFRDAPTSSVGDNGVFAGSVSESNYLGYLDVLFDRVFASSVVKGFGVPAVGSEINFDPSPGTQNIFALAEARDALVPISGQTITVTLEVLRD